MASVRSEEADHLFQALLTLQSVEECYRFFEDICTIREIESISQRLEVARQLKAGRVYTDIAASTGASTATISRVNRCLAYGAGGYEMVLQRMEVEEITEGNKAEE